MTHAESQRDARPVRLGNVMAAYLAGVGSGPASAMFALAIAHDNSVAAVFMGAVVGGFAITAALSLIDYARS